MNELRSRLIEWRSRGLITVDQEEAIAAIEGGADPAATDRRLLEGLVYLGAALFAYGALIIAFDVGAPDRFFTADDNRWGTFLVALGTSAALGFAAWLISERTSNAVADRAVGFTLLVAWVAFAVAEIVLVADIIDLGRASVVVVGLALLAVAFPMYRWRPGAPTHLPFAIASIVTIAGFLVLVFGESDVFGSAFGFSDTTTLAFTAGVAFLAFGLGWMHLADRGHLRPRNLGYLLGGIAAFAGAQFFTGIATGWVIVALGLGVFITLAGVWRQRSMLLAIGAVITIFSFAELLELIFEDSARSAGVVLLLAGVAALGAVIMRSDSVPPPQNEAPSADA